MTKNDTQKINVRNLAVDILLSVTRDGVFSHIAIRDMLDKYRYLPKQERAFLTRLAQGTLERMIEIDAIIDSVSKTKVKKMKPVIAAILRTGVYQLKFMDAVPNSAACNEAVKLAQKRGFSGLKGFVNGVMRSAARSLDEFPYPDFNKEPVRSLAVRYSMPEWIVKRFADQYGYERCEQILAAYLKPHPTSVQVDTGRAAMDDVIKSLTEQNIKAEKNPITARGLFLSGYGALDEISEFNDGLLYVQDTASMLAVELADPKPGDYVIDVCAAPGGKSIYAARLVGNEGSVDARDLTESKVELIEENIERCHLENVMHAKAWDARILDESAVDTADIVIADLPCSGLGVIGTKVDIKYNASEEKIKELSALQREILDTVCAYVKPGGTLLYSTCTITKEENEDNAAWFLTQHPEFSLEEQRQYLPDEGCDGFFMAKFVKA